MDCITAILIKNSSLNNMFCPSKAMDLSPSSDPLSPGVGREDFEYGPSSSSIGIDGVGVDREEVSQIHDTWKIH